MTELLIMLTYCVLEISPCGRNDNRLSLLKVRLEEAREGKDGAAKPPHPCPLSPPPIALPHLGLSGVISTSGRNPRIAYYITLLSFLLNLNLFINSLNDNSLKLT